MGEEEHVIARIWHGRVPSSKARAYRGFLIKWAVPDYGSAEGNPGVLIVERKEGGATHFLVISFWEDMETMRRFADDDVEDAKYYEGGQGVLAGVRAQG